MKAFFISSLFLCHVNFLGGKLVKESSNQAKAQEPKHWVCLKRMPLHY